MDLHEILIGIAEIATTLTGFTGIVVAFGSGRLDSWQAGDKLRLRFLLEASLSAAGYALIALLFLSFLNDTRIVWGLLSAMWASVTLLSLHRARKLLRELELNQQQSREPGNNVISTLFFIALAVQLMNIVSWQHVAPFLGALILNLMGAAMQFARLIRSAFQTNSQEEQHHQTISMNSSDKLQVRTDEPEHTYFKPDYSGV